MRLMGWRGSARPPPRQTPRSPAQRFPDGQFFLPLHAHTPGQGPVEPADVLVSLLLTAGLIPQRSRPVWRPGPPGGGIRWPARRSCCCSMTRPATSKCNRCCPASAGSLVLVTSRRRLAALHDAAVISLDILPADEAARLLALLAGRAEVDACDVAVGKIARLSGYLPLAIGMLAARLRHHPAWTPAQARRLAGPGQEPAERDAGSERSGRRRVRPVLPGPALPASSGCSGGSAWSPARASTPLPLPHSMASACRRLGSSLMTCMTSTWAPTRAGPLRAT